MSAKDDYAILMERLDCAGSARLRRILEYLMTPEQARLAVELPGTPEQVAQKTGVPADRVKEQFDELYFKGVVFPRDFDNREHFRFARSIGQFHDSTQATQHRDVVRDRPLFQAWHDFVISEMYPRIGKARAGQARPHLRIVPAYKAIKDLPGMLPCEDIREILKAHQLIAVVPCSCRYRTTSVGEQCKLTKEAEHWHCIQFGRGAEYAIKRGSGKKLSLDQALQLVDEIEEDGLLHTWANNTNLTGHPLVCNCCRDCCLTYCSMDIVSAPIGNVWAKSRYQAEVNADDCNGCQVCLDRCLFDAIEMRRPAGSGEEKAAIHAEKCFGCGSCVVGCAPGAIKMRVVRPPEHIPVAVLAA